MTDAELQQKFADCAATLPPGRALAAGAALVGFAGLPTLAPLAAALAG